jgi:hypothetical protein
MAFKPSIAADLRLMDARLFQPEPINLINDIEANRLSGRLRHPSHRDVMIWTAGYFVSG